MSIDTTRDDAPTRYEMNRLVRSVLTRFSIDLELITVSCTARMVYLYGFLTKVTKPDLKPIEVDNIFREIQKIPMVRGIEASLENWTINTHKGTGEWLVEQKIRVLRPVAASTSVEPEEHRIDEAEKLEDVLDDIKKG
jgi:hypothetical protein